jgi:hypothetical protein
MLKSNDEHVMVELGVFSCVQIQEEEEVKKTSWRTLAEQRNNCCP